MAKAKSVTIVTMEIARLAWATRSLSSQEEWATWAQTFVEALATGRKELNAFAAELMQDVHAARAEHAAYMAKSRENKQVVKNVNSQEAQPPVASTLATPSLALPSSSLKTSPKKKNPSDSAPPAPKDPLTEEVLTLWYPSGPARSDWPLIGKALSELKAKGATPDTLRIRYEAARKAWDGKPFTILAIIKHWDTLLPKTNGHTTPAPYRPRY